MSYQLAISRLSDKADRIVAQLALAEQNGDIATARTLTARLSGLDREMRQLLHEAPTPSLYGAV